ncbi:hypothetical protein [Synechococcus sp. PCC 6312]|uniref:hypothetical protein n=1 Tax=Synechococcus sp. (strain ATCC 27167 / PCC 6312) TaxID=195253 RepID=UPI00029EF736|nr:hypothetical protein [Synechococcus sp. PCC 6312]AFY62576.1 hypothetical protein Syn6312_3556 [Synechococcus sp. PCC 6312]
MSISKDYKEDQSVTPPEGQKLAVPRQLIQIVGAKINRFFRIIIFFLKPIIGYRDFPIESHLPSVGASVNSAVPRFRVEKVVQRLIEAHGPTTIKVRERPVSCKHSHFICYDATGNYIGRVGGRPGRRYWEDSSGWKHY